MKFFKAYLILFIFLCSMVLSAQEQVVKNSTEMITLVSESSKFYGGSTYFVNPKRVIEGSVYLFDEWENYTIIHTTNNRKYLLKNINLNIKRNTFESKINQDSLFSFTFNNIDKFVINGKIYKNYYWNDDNRVYEVIASGKNFEILKGFSVKYIEGSPNPMLNRTSDKYIRKEKYYLKKEDRIGFFNLKRSAILSLLNLNEQQKEKVLDFVKERKLSFRKERDIKIIVDFANKIK